MNKTGQLLIAAMFVILTYPLAAEETSGQFQNAGLTLHYSVIGKGSPVVVLAGGPGFDAKYMNPVCEMLAPTHQVILLQQRGTGDSTPAKEDATTVNEDLVVADVEALRQKLGADRISVLGHSFGTFTAMRYAIAHPDRVASLVLLGTLPPRSADNTSDQVMASRLPPKVLKRLGEIDAAWPKASPSERDKLGREVATLTLPGALADPKKTSEILAAFSSVQTNGETTHLLNRATDNYDLKDQLAKLHLPVLIVQGREDFLDVKTAEKTRDAIPGAKLVVLEKCGHFAWIEAPAALQAAVIPFLAEH